MSTFGQQARIYISPANEEPIGGELVIFGDTESGETQTATVIVRQGD
jgi:hypothetical protein